MYFQTMLCYSYTYVMIFIIWFLNSNKLCITSGFATQENFGVRTCLWVWSVGLLKQNQLCDRVENYNYLIIHNNEKRQTKQ